jgi:hypothetical protein
MTKLIELPYTPRPAFLPFHDRTQRWAIGVAHRRAGKTVAAVNDMIRRAVLLERQDPIKPGKYAYIAPLYNQAKRVAWNYLKEFSRPLWAKPPNESELYVTLVNNAQIRVFGADNPDSIRGDYLDGVLLDEYADMRPSVWGQVIRPMLVDYRGWAVFIGTPKGHNEFYEMYTKALLERDRWFTFMLKASQSGILSPEELEEVKREIDPDQFAQELECSFDAAIKGAYYREAFTRIDEEKRICRVPIDRGIPVHTSWDLGYTDATAIWFFQVVGREIRVIDYYERSQADIPHFVKILDEKRDAGGYIYGKHYLPHDVAQHQVQTGRSTFQQLQSLKVPPTIVEMHAKLDGIYAVRRMLDRCVFDGERTERGIECLRQYHQEWDERVKQYKLNPKHDWTSHGADAFRMFAAGFSEPQLVDRKRYKRPRYTRKIGSSSWQAA